MAELSQLGKKHEISVYYDLGSGSLLESGQYGVDDPGIRQAICEGADLPFHWIDPKEEPKEYPVIVQYRNSSVSQWASPLGKTWSQSVKNYIVTGWIPTPKKGSNQ